MAAGPNTQVADVVVPEIFTPYVQQLTEEKSRLIQSGAVVVDPQLTSFLNGGGLTVNMPSFNDLDNDPENISADNPADTFKRPNWVTPRTDSVPYKITTSTEVAVRLSRNNSWASADLAAALAGADPMDAIANRVAAYWTRRLQAAFIATVSGNFAQNATATPANAVQNDMTHDVSGSAYAAGVTDFNAENFIDATVLLGDSMEDLTMVMMHSVVYARAQKNNLIDFIPDARGEITIPTFLGRQVIVDDSMPASNGVYETWLFGSGAIRFGQGSPKVPTEVQRYAQAGNGGGQEILYNRVEWVLHPVGNAFVGTPIPNGGPSNANTSGNLAHEDSWERVYRERKQIKIARLITREHA
jgi:hypothetical protein